VQQFICVNAPFQKTTVLRFYKSKKKGKAKKKDGKRGNLCANAGSGEILRAVNSLLQKHVFFDLYLQGFQVEFFVNFPKTITRQGLHPIAATIFQYRVLFIELLSAAAITDFDKH